MKNKTGSIVAIVLLSLLACGLVFATYFGIKYISLGDFSNSRFFSAESQRLALEKEFDLKTINLINTETESSDISYIKGDENSDKILVRIYANEDKIVSADKEDNTLNVSVKGSCKGFCFGFSNDRVEITLPENYDGDFVNRSDTGDIRSDSFTHASFNLNTNAGDIDITVAKSITINTDAGDIDIQSAEDISIDSNAGDITIGECFNKLHIKTNAGDIKINELQLSQNADIETDAGDVSINNAGNAYVDAHAKFGDVNIQNNNRMSDIELKIETNAGDIKVN